MQLPILFQTLEKLTEKYHTQRTFYKKEGNPFYGKYHTEETKRKMRVPKNGVKAYFANLRINKVCEYCGQDFKAVASRKDTAKYCSRLCQNRYQAIHKNGFKGKHHTIEQKTKWSKNIKQNPLKLSIAIKNLPKNTSLEHNGNWKGGKSFEPYSLEFNSTLKEKIRKRDNYICQNCSKTQEQELKDIHRKLTCHHIDYNKKNCKESNLITVCHRCNIRANSDRDYWQKYYTEKLRILLCQ